MNPTFLARQSVIFISLFYFLPLIGGIGILTSPQPSGSPSFIFFLSLLTILLLVFPGAGMYIYASVYRPQKKFGLLGIVAIGIVGLLIFICPLLGQGASGLGALIFSYLPACIHPVLAFFFLPVWFTVPHAGKPYHIPQIIAVLVPVVPLLFMISLFGQHIAVPENFILLYTLIFILLPVLAGIILLYRGITHPEIPENIQTQDVSS